MGFKATLDPSILKVIIIALLLFVEGVALPAYGVTGGGRFPEPVEWMAFFLGAIIQVATFLLTFLGYQKPEGS